MAETFVSTQREDVIFKHAINTYSCCGVYVPTGLYTRGWTGVEAATWLTGGRPCARHRERALLEVLEWRALQEKELASGKAGGDPQTRLLAVSPG